MFAARSRCAANRVATPSASGEVILCPRGCRKTEVADFSGNQLYRVLAIRKSFHRSIWRRSRNDPLRRHTAANNGSKDQISSCFTLQFEIHRVRDLLRKGCPVGVTEHPRASALAPGGDSGAVPTTMAISSGGRMATPNGRRYSELPQCKIRAANDWISIQINRALDPKSGVQDT